MSAISEKVRTALFGKLNVSTVLSSGTGYATAIYYKVAESDAVLPYVVYDRVAPGPVKFVLFGPEQVLEDDLWQVTAYTDRQTTPNGMEPIQLGQTILTACETAIGDDLTLTGSTVQFCKRVSDIPGGRELVNDRHIFREGFNLRVQAS
jgi:hypothetical protein